jgi:murein DD-endopeptidase MepM/ murein hydrolase activator NlpD
MSTLKISPQTLLPNPGGHKPEEKDLKRACREFEAIFTYQLLKGMRRTVEKCDLFHGGQGEDIYESLLDMELAKGVTGLGPNSLAEQLYQQLTRSESEYHGDEAVYSGSLKTAWKMNAGLPVEAPISSDYGWRRDPLEGDRRFHRGIDFAAQAGSPVRAVLAGKVVHSGQMRGYGNVVILDHGRGLTTIYAHNRKNTVREGTWVTGGMVIAEVGSTGRSTDPHLHFEVRNENIPQDPSRFLSSIEKHAAETKRSNGVNRPASFSGRF